jgi:hypothetical protein
MVEASDAYAALWGLKHRTLRGKDYGFIDYKNPHRHRPFLLYPLSIQPKVKGYKKSRQAGVSESSVTETLWALDKYRMNVVYTFPSPKQVEDFSNTRVKPALTSVVGVDGLMGEPQNVTLRKIGNGYLFLRSSTNEKLGEGIDADMVVFDEIDRMRRNVGVAFKESLSASRWGWVRELSTPTLPGRGIDETWQKSNQMHWFVRCEACGETQALKYPDNILELKKVQAHEKLIPPGSYAFCCAKCKSQKINRYEGFWVPAYPKREIVVFHINQLICPWISADEIMQKKRDYRFPQLFWNYVLGLEYLGNSQLLTRPILERLIDTDLKLYSARTAEYSTISVGIDWGQFNWAVVIGRRPEGRKDLLGLKVVEDSSEPLSSAKEIADFIRPFKPDIIVPDLGYGKDRCAYMLGQFPGRVFSCSYVDNSKVIIPKFSESTYSVNVDRTAWLKGMASGFREGELVLPDYEIEPLLGTFISHMTSICVLIEEGDEGKIREKVENTGDDHFAHATGYALMGLEFRDDTGGGFAFDFV